MPELPILPSNRDSLRVILTGDEALIAKALTLPFAGPPLRVDILPVNTLLTDEPSAAFNLQDVALVIALREVFDGAFLEALDVFCEQHHLPWCQFHVHQSVGWFGPFIVPGQTADYRDLLVRRLCAAQDLSLQQSEMALPAFSGSLLLSPNELGWMFSLFFALIERWLLRPEEKANELVGVEISANPLTLALTRSLVLPLPEHVLPEAPPCGMESAVNPRCGIVLGTALFEHHPSVPAGLVTVQAHSTQMQHVFSTWCTFSSTLGSSFEGEVAARNAAIGEAIERYCLNYLPGVQAVFATYDALMAQGEAALDPQQLILFSAQFYAADGCPFVPFTRQTAVYWVKGYSLTRQCPAWLPLTLVYPFWQAGHFPGQPNTHDAHFPGVAAAGTLEQALACGIEELVERDSLMLWWLNRQPLPAVKLPASLEAHWLGGPAALGQRAWAIYLHNEFALPVMAGVVENTAEQLLNIGFACRPNAASATLKAWSEALTLQERSRDLNRPNSLLRREYKHAALKPWRADRAYLGLFRSDFRDVHDDLAQQQFFLDPRAIERIRPWVDTPATLSFDALPVLEDRSLGHYQKRIEARGYEIFYTDLTTPDVARLGLRVVRTLIPGLVPDFPAAFPHIGNRRIQHTPLELGWRTTPLAESDLNFLPIPHA